MIMTRRPRWHNSLVKVEAKCNMISIAITPSHLIAPGTELGKFEYTHTNTQIQIYTNTNTHTSGIAISHALFAGPEMKKVVDIVDYLWCYCYCYCQSYLCTSDVTCFCADSLQCCKRKPLDNCLALIKPLFSRLFQRGIKSLKSFLPPLPQRSWIFFWLRPCYCDILTFWPFTDEKPPDTDCAI